MTPHKDLTKLPVDDQLKLLRNTIDDTNYEVSAQGVKLRVVHNDLKILRTEVKDVRTEVKQISKKIDKLYNMISGFIGRIKGQDQEIAAIAFRKEEHETGLSRLKKTV